MGDSLSILCVIIFIVLNQNTTVKVMFLQVQIKENLFLILTLTPIFCREYIKSESFI